MREYIPKEEQAFVEQIVKQAGNYVTASDDLRPRIVEAARDGEDGRRALRMAGVAALAISALFVISIPISRSAEHFRHQMRGPSGEAILQGASQRSASDPTWQLVEYFSSSSRPQPASTTPPELTNPQSSEQHHR